MRFRKLFCTSWSVYTYMYVAWYVMWEMLNVHAHKVCISCMRNSTLFWFILRLVGHGIYNISNASSYLLNNIWKIFVICCICLRFWAVPLLAHRNYLDATGFASHSLLALSHHIKWRVTYVLISVTWVQQMKTVHKYHSQESRGFAAVVF